MSKLEQFKKDKQKSSFKKRRELSENMDLFLFRNMKRLSMGCVELFNNVVFHGFDTLKVRLQAKCLFDDNSLFFKNKVENKPLISGVTSAGLGSFLAGYCFIFSNEKFLLYFFRKNKNNFISGLEWRTKLISAFILSDIMKVSVFLPFETRKQRIQLYQNVNEIGIGNISKYMFRAYIPMILRDVIFRVITLGCFLNSLNVQHQPSLKYDLREIKEYIRMKEKAKENINVSYFMDYGKFYIHSPFHMILTTLIFSSIFATFITQPFDVIITKILTQTSLKYKGLVSSYFIIAKEEGYKKLFLSGLSARLSFNTLSAMSVFLLYENINATIKNYYSSEN